MDLATCLVAPTNEINLVKSQTDLMCLYITALLLVVVVQTQLHDADPLFAPVT